MEAYYWHSRRVDEAPYLWKPVYAFWGVVMTQVAENPVVSKIRSLRTYEIVALQVPISYNRHSDHDHDGLMFALKRNYEHLRELGEPNADGTLRFHPDEPDPLVRPLVLRACVGETVSVVLTNHMKRRRVGLHLVGGGYDVNQHDGARVGGNPDSTLAPSEEGTYEWQCDHEGVFVLHDAADLGGTEDSSNLHGLFGVLVVEPVGTVWRDSSGQEMAQHTDPHNPEPGDSSAGEVDGLYVDVYPPGAGNNPKSPWLEKPPKYVDRQAAFREYVIVFHDEPEIVNHSDLTRVRPPWGEEQSPHPGHAGGVSHVMPISYRAEPMINRERLIWSRLTGTPVSAGDPAPPPLEVPVVNEEQHHSSWMFGDPATPVLPAYLGDPVRIRLVHCGVKETHVYHLHLYAWHADATNYDSPLIDAITISPQTGVTIEPLYTAGNRQLVPGDVIWHCHLYPHFHHGMWGLFRTYDRIHTRPLQDLAVPWVSENGRPDVDCYPDGTPIPPLLVLPDREEPPTPTNQDPGWPRFMMETRSGTQLPADPLDRAGRPGQKSPRVPWIWDTNNVPPGVVAVPLPDGFDYRSATTSEREFFFQHRNEQAQPGVELNTNPEPGWMAPYLAFADGRQERVDRHIEVLREPFLYNRHGWHDPRGHRFRLADPHATDVLSDTELRDGAATYIAPPAHGTEPEPVMDRPSTQPMEQHEPLFFRIHDGDPVRLTLHNRITYPIPGDKYDHALPRPGVPGLWECGLHVHMVKFDVVCADGAASGWNYMSAPRPGYRLDYRWWADEEFGVIFTHDHLFANYRQKRGLFGAMLVEPKDSVWLDPWNPDQQVIAGEQAVIVVPSPSDTNITPPPSPRFFRELALGVSDFIPLHDKEGRELNPPVMPTSDGDQGSMGMNYRSAPLRERPGDPSKWFTSQKDDTDTPLLHSYPGDPIWLRLVAGAHEEQHSFSVNGMRWRRFRNDPKSPLSSQQTMGLSEAFTFTINENGECLYGPGDYLWRMAGIDDTWLGCWGLLRVHQQPSQDLPTLQQALNTALPSHATTPTVTNNTNPAAGQNQPIRRYTVDVTQQRLVYREDLVDRFALVYQITEGTHPDGSPITTPETAGHNDQPLNPGDIEPLVLRCLAGEEVHVTLRNRLSTDPEDTLKPEPFAPAVPIDLPERQRPVSQRVSLHADLVCVDVMQHDGSYVGRNPDSTVAPGEERTYIWSTDVELGPLPLYDLADVRNHRHHGLVGALIVEPPGALPVQVNHRDDGDEAPLEHQAWTGVQAVVHTPSASVLYDSGDQAAHTKHEEVVLVLQDGLRLFIDDNLAVPFPDVPPDPGEDDVDPEDQGQKAINYRSNPTGRQKNWLSGSPSLAAHYSVPPNSEVDVHLVGGFDKPRNHSLNIHGMSWPEWPHNGNPSPHVGAEGGLSVNSIRTLHLHTGSGKADHAIRSGVVRYTVSQGLWALLNVEHSGSDSLPATQKK